MKNKLKKSWYILFIILIITFIYLKYKSYNYKINYVVDKYKIIEEYNKTNEYYNFYIKNNKIIYPYKIKNKYVKKREIIEKINIYTNDNNENCILPESKYISFYPLCYNDKEVITYNLSNIEIKNFKYQKITKNNIVHDKLNINYLNDTKFLLYNYKGFYYLNNDSIKEIKLFNKDIYSLNLIYQLNEYLIIPDYNQNYFFNKMYILNINTGKVDEIKIDYDISFDSIFLGDYKNNVYLLDRKEQLEYKIKLKKKKIIKSDFVILKNNKLINATYQDIINNNLKFDNTKSETYKIINNKIFQIINNNRILISNKDVSKIIKEDNDTVYYLSKEDLYMYNNIYGEVLIINNFEWNFNTTNMIFLYK